jgi:hypothetical protein
MVQSVRTLEENYGHEKVHDGKTDLSRRNVLLGGTTLAAASAITSTGSVQTAQAQ